MRLRFLLFVLCVSGAVMNAQTARRIGPSQGLLHPTVYDVAQDPFGFVWIGTRDGLFRYNEGRAVGMEFLPEGLAPARNIQSLCVRQDSTLWMGLAQLGVLSYDIQLMQPKPLGYPRLDDGISVQALHEDGHGRLWAGTSGQGLYYLDDEAAEWRTVSFAYAPEELMFVFDFADQGDTIWIGNSGEHLLYYLYSDDRVHSFAESEEFQSYSKSVDVQGGQVLFGIAEHGLWEISGGQLSQLPSPSTNPRDVAYEGQEIWVSTDGNGMFVRDAEENWTQWSKQDPQLGIATDQFYSITPVGSDFWVGTFNDGVTLFPRGNRPIEKLRNPDSFTYTSIQSALSIEASGSSIWVGYDGDGLVRYDFSGGAWKPTAFLDNERNDYPQVVTSMQSNNDGSIWLGTFNDGLLHIDPNGQILKRFMAFTDFSFGLNNNNIWSLAPAGGDSLWVGTLGGLQLWDGKEFLTPWQEPWAVGRNIMDLERQGTVLWVASE
ncbi:MAG: two-component regulator propeller domain-containing protein, partial [Schleiferiaceae bacterium]